MHQQHLRGSPMKPESLNQILEMMWQNYLKLNPDAQKIYHLFAKRNPQLINDHIALRTFDLPQIDIHQIADPFIKRGYVAAEEYHFPHKKLFAQHFLHPDPTQPKLFISQLLTGQFSTSLQETVRQFSAHIDSSKSQQSGFSYSGRHWPISFQTYQQLERESDYAAWVYAMGFQPNHFTLLINALKSHPNLSAVNRFLLAQGFELNDNGGLIKGGPSALLAQSSTRANLIPVEFEEGIQRIPGCYYEFAYRYPQADGTLFHGFVAESADKIFQSTDRQRS